MIERSLRSVAEAIAPAVTVGRLAEVSEADAASFQIVRPRLFGIAYRVLGSAAKRMTWSRRRGSAGTAPTGPGTRCRRISRHDDVATRDQRLAIRACSPRKTHRCMALRPGRRRSRSLARRRARRRGRVRGAHARAKVSPANEPPTYFEKRSTTRTGSRTGPRTERGERQATRHPCATPSLRRTSRAGRCHRAPATSRRLHRRCTDRRSRIARTAARHRVVAYAAGDERPGDATPGEGTFPCPYRGVAPGPANVPHSPPSPPPPPHRTRPL